ncbi:MAG: hypothetical protein K2Q18_14325 [Bdellovibrionales bacterium]|nr:hypothetical protein [Bdellovibrionales bacterium]
MKILILQVILLISFPVFSAEKIAPVLKKITTGKKSAVTSNVNPEVMAKIKSDFESAINGSVIPGVGDSMSWAGGTLTRTRKGELRYVNTENGYYGTSMDVVTDPVKLANECPAINSMWISQYGVNLADVDGQNQQDAYKNQVLHLAQYGLATTYSKKNPWPIGNGLIAFN